MIKVMDGFRKSHMIGVKHIVHVEPWMVTPWHLAKYGSEIMKKEMFRGTMIWLVDGKSIEIMEDPETVFAKIRAIKS